MNDFLEDTFESFSEGLGRQFLEEVRHAHRSYRARKTAASEKMLVAARKDAIERCSTSLEFWKTARIKIDAQTLALQAASKKMASWPEEMETPAMRLSREVDPLASFSRGVWIACEAAFRSEIPNGDDGESRLFEMTKQASRPAISVGFKKKIDLKTGIGGLEEWSSEMSPELASEGEDFGPEVELKIDEAITFAKAATLIHDAEVLVEPNRGSHSNDINRQFEKKANAFLSDLAENVQFSDILPLGQKRSANEHKLEVAFLKYLRASGALSRVHGPDLEGPLTAARDEILVSFEDLEVEYDTRLSSAKIMLEDTRNLTLAEFGVHYVDRHFDAETDIFEAAFATKTADIRAAFTSRKQKLWRTVFGKEIRAISARHGPAGHPSEPDPATDIEPSSPFDIDAVHQVAKARAEDINQIVENAWNLFLLDFAREEQADYDYFCAQVRQDLDHFESLKIAVVPLDEIREKVIAINQNRRAFLDAYVVKSKRQYQDAIETLGHNLLMMVVLPLWITYGALVPEARLYLNLKLLLRDASRATGNVMPGLPLSRLGGNRDKLRAMSELVALGCAARVIDRHGTTVFFEDDLLEQLDDKALNKLVSGNREEA